MPAKRVEHSSSRSRRGRLGHWQRPSERTVVFTDGACIGNPGPVAGPGRSTAVDSRSGADPHTTNQRMELTAVARGGCAPLMARARDRERLDLRRELLPGPLVGRLAGVGAGAMRSGQPVANQDLWEPLIEEVIDQRAGRDHLPLGQGPRRRSDERARRRPGATPRHGLTVGERLLEGSIGSARPQGRASIVD